MDPAPPATLTISSAQDRVGGLDGLRAVNLWIVIGAHAQVSWLSGGAMAVDVFFVISGFLITHLLLRERAAYGRIDLKRFWLRRALRLLPALVVMVLFVDLVVVVLVRDAYSLASVASTPFVLGYVGNWLIVATHSPALGWFGPTWSLSVEEQFYVLWPLVLLMAYRVAARRSRSPLSVLGVAAGALIVVADVTRAVTIDGTDPYPIFATPARMDMVLIGVLLALAVQAGRTRLLVRVTRVLVLPALAYLALVCVGVPEFGSPGSVPVLRAYWTLGMPLVGLAAVIVVAHCWLQPTARVSRALSWRPLAATGRISYGMYLWHYPVIMVLLGQVHVRPEVLFVLALAGTYAAGLTSWFLIERPLTRRFHARLSRVAAEPALGRPAAGSTQTVRTRFSA